MAKHTICSWINQLFLWPFSQTFFCLPGGHQWIFEAVPYAFPIIFRQVLHGFPWVFPMVFHGFSHGHAITGLGSQIVRLGSDSDAAGSRRGISLWFVDVYGAYNIL